MHLDITYVYIHNKIYEYRKVKTTYILERREYVVIISALNPYYLIFIYFFYLMLYMNKLQASAVSVVIMIVHWHCANKTNVTCI